MPAQSPWQLVIAAAVQHALCLQIQHQCWQHQIYAAQQAEYEDSSSSSGSSSDHGSDLSNSSSSSSSSSSYSQASSSSLSIGLQDIFMEVHKSLHHTYTISTCHAWAFIGLLLTTHCIFPHEVTKCSQLGLVLNCFKFDDTYHFQLNLCVSPSTFNTLLTLVENHPVFYNSSHQDQMPVECQLAIALYRFGHFGNAASVELVAQWARCSTGSVVNATCRVIRSFLLLHDQAICWPNAEEKREASDWIESVSCHAWHLGFCMVDRTLIPLHSKPRHYGEQFFDCKSNYSLSLMVCFSPFFNFLYLCYS